MEFPLIHRSALDAVEQKYVSLEQEYRNYRRRTAEIQEKAYYDGGSDAIKQLLPVFDNLNRALEQSTEDLAFRVGIEMTMNHLKKIMAAMDVEEIPAVGELFDPNVHEAVEHIQDENQGEGVVTKVILTGFRRGTVVLRHSLVVVAN